MNITKGNNNELFLKLRIDLNRYSRETDQYKAADFKIYIIRRIKLQFFLTFIVSNHILFLENIN